MSISLKKTMIAASAGVVTVTGLFFTHADIGYKVSFNGYDMGYVEDPKVFNEAVEIVGKDLYETYGDNVVFEKDIDFDVEIVHRDEILKDVSDGVKAVKDTYPMPVVKGAVIVVDGKEMVSLNSVEDAESVIDKVLEPYVRESNDAQIIGEPMLQEDVKIVEKEIPYKDVIQSNEAVTILNQGTEKKEQYTVETGDTTWDIAANRGMKVEALKEANPEKDIDQLYDGDTINLTVTEPCLNVKVEKEERVDERIDFVTEYKEDASLDQGKEKVVKEGRQGLKQVTSKVQYLNGEVTSREVIKEDVVKESTPRVVARGTKAVPVGTGKSGFTLPTYGRISALDKAGSHSGGRAVDIANNAGTPIKAASEGTVATATLDEGGYGNYVTINHDNGYATLYGHLSKIRVEVGQKVNTGDLIGDMGSTGRSTGPHLHFEVRKNDIRQIITDYFEGLKVNVSVSPVKSDE